MADALPDRLAALAALNRDRTTPEPLAVTWWEIARLGRDDLTPLTPVAIGTRTVRRTDAGALEAVGVLRFPTGQGSDMTQLRAAASLASEWYLDGVEPFTFPGRHVRVEEDGEHAVHLVVAHGVPEHFSVQDAFGAMFETERAVLRALGFSPTLLSRPPWT